VNEENYKHNVTWKSKRKDVLKKSRWKRCFSQKNGKGLCAFIFHYSNQVILQLSKHT